MRLLKEDLKMFIYKDAVGFVGNVGVWSDGMGGYVLVDLLTDNRLYVHWILNISAGFLEGFPSKSPTPFTFLVNIKIF